MSTKDVIGTCSECGGPVEQYRRIDIVGPFPPARCRRCGAEEATPYGRTIPMRKPSAHLGAVGGE